MKAFWKWLWLSRDLFEKNRTITVLQLMGVFLFLLGLLLFLALSLMSMFGADINGLGVPAAFAFLLIMLAMSFLFPDMLKGGPNDSVSTMRVAVYMIVCVFVFLSVKFGWAAKNFSEITLDESWTYIMIAALGGKAVQAFGERLAMGAAKPGKESDAAAGGTPPSGKTPKPGAGAQPQ